GISSFTQMLLEGADASDPKTALLEKIEKQTFRAAKIVNGLLNLSRTGSGDNERISVDVNAVIGDVFVLLEHQFTAQRITVRRELDRKSTRLNSSHQIISYAVFCLKKKTKRYITRNQTSRHTNTRTIYRLTHPLHTEHRND